MRARLTTNAINTQLPQPTSRLNLPAGPSSAPRTRTPPQGGVARRALLASCGPWGSCGVGPRVTTCCSPGWWWSTSTSRWAAWGARTCSSPPPGDGVVLTAPPSKQRNLAATCAESPRGMNVCTPFCCTPFRPCQMLPTPRRALISSLSSAWWAGLGWLLVSACMTGFGAAMSWGAAAASAAAQHAGLHTACA